ncbi:MAG: Long-chain-fatty-acid--luciferin-component ligase [Verrucomicrobiales bacterium]|jgi:hypothetical protein|nr:Long-chain-fatty-acid--luciferin-component ligase [Verrucomicrobiales bacterium]
MEKLPALNNYAKRLRAFIDASASQFAPPENFNTLASDLLALQRVFNPIYARYCESLGVGSPRDWQDFAFLPTSSFKDFEVSVLAKEERTTVFRSSGTTQANRSAHYHNEASLELYEHSLLAWFRRHTLNGAVKDLKILSLSPPPKDVPESSLGHMFETVSLELPESHRLGYFAELGSDGGWKLNLPALQKTLNELSEFKVPVLLLGTAFSFVHLLDGIEPLQMAPGSRVMETGGYKGRSRVISKEELHRSISRLLGIPPASIVTEYGMSELSSQAYDRICGEDSSPIASFRFPPWVRARIISPESGNAVEDGEAGLLQVLDLANAYSAAAIQTEDVAVKTGESFQLLGRSESAIPRGCSLMPAA